MTILGALEGTMPRVTSSTPAKPRRTTAPRGSAPKKPASSAASSTSARVKDGFEVAATRSAGAAKAAAIELLVKNLARDAAEAGIKSGAIAAGDPKLIAAEAGRSLLANPQSKELLSAVLPHLTAAAGRLGPRYASAMAKAGEALVKSGVSSALLKAAGEVGGVGGRRLVGAALRGFANGGTAERVAAEFASTAIKMGAKQASKSGATGLAKILGKAMPLLGNAVNLVTTATSLVKAIKVSVNPAATKADKVAAWTLLATSVGGIFLPWIGVAGDVAGIGYAAVKAGKAPVA